MLIHEGFADIDGVRMSLRAAHNVVESEVCVGDDVAAMRAPATWTPEEFQRRCVRDATDDTLLGWLEYAEAIIVTALLLDAQADAA